MSDVEFQEALRATINRFSRENGSNTPDFILGAYLLQCLGAFEQASNARGKWYGPEDAPLHAELRTIDDALDLAGAPPADTRVGRIRKWALSQVRNEAQEKI